MLSKRIEILGIAACLTLVVVSLQLKKFPEFKHCDSEHYKAMAEGHSEEAPLAFARRIFHPWVVGKLRQFVDTDIAFLIVETISLFSFLLVALTLLYYYIKQPLIIGITFIFLPYIFWLVEYLYNPTLFFIFLSSLFFLLLVHKKYLMSLLALFFLLLTRDEAYIIFIGFVIALLRCLYRDANKKRIYYSYILGSFIVLILSQVIIAHHTRNNFNIFHMPHWLFLLFKPPCYALRHFLGIRQWVDTYQSLPGYTHAPWVAFEAPIWLRNISNIKQFGIYDWNFMEVAYTLLLTLAVFGTGPTIVLYFLRKKIYKAFSNSLVFDTALFYGCAMFILVPFLGTMLQLSYTNAWPLFFLIMPIFLKEIWRRNRRIFVKIIICYFLSAWLFVLSYNARGFNFFMALIIIEIILHWYTWNMLSLVSMKGLYPEH